MQKNKSNEQYARLRTNAEKALTKARQPSASLSDDEMDAVLQELQVHQIELEMQNEELRIANEEIELQRLKFESLYDLAPIGYFILDSYGIIEEVNDAGMKLLDTGRANIRLKRLESFVAPAHHDEFYRFWRTLQKSDDKQRCQIKFVAKNGSEFYALLEGRVVQLASKSYIAMIDVTEVIEARMRLAETKDRLELALEASDAGTWELHIPSMRFFLDEINYRICNAVAGKFENSYACFIELVHPEDRFTVDQHFRTAVNNDKEIDIISRFLNTSGKICYASIRGHLVHGDAETEKRFIGIMWDITEKKQLEDMAYQQEQTRQKEITTATLHAGENERRRISEALHDSVSQLLYGIKIQLGQMNEENRPQATTRLNQLLDIAIKETRNISFELAPPTLTDFGLPATIAELCERLSTPQMKITAVVSGFTQRMDLLLESTIFRIIQELVNNCMKHSGANNVRIHLKKNKMIEIMVSDNGRGFALEELERKPHVAGIASIRNRLSLYNGTLSIDTAPEKGTIVRITLET